MPISCKFPFYGIKACFNATLDCYLSDSRLRYQGFSMNGQGWFFRKQPLKIFVTVQLQHLHATGLIMESSSLCTREFK